MPLFDSWHEFSAVAEVLAAVSPMKTRSSLKFRKATHTLTLKVTDGKTCAMYTTESREDIGRVLELQLLLSSLFTSKNSVLCDKAGEIKSKKKSG